MLKKVQLIKSWLKICITSDLRAAGTGPGLTKILYTDAGAGFVGKYRVLTGAAAGLGPGTRTGPTQHFYSLRRAPGTFAPLTISNFLLVL